jgi:hypothetical protein
MGVRLKGLAADGHTPEILRHWANRLRPALTRYHASELALTVAAET